MKKFLSTLLMVIVSLTAAAQYQMSNAGFEEWESVSGGEEPVAWSSFLTATGGYSSVVAKEQLFKATEVCPGSSGQYSAKITARSVFGNIAQGNMTSGCINAGSMSASDGSGNYNYTNEENEGQAMRFTGRPDAIRLWVNLYAAASAYPTGNISVFLHEKGYYQDPNNANVGKLAPVVAHAKATPQSSGSASYSEEGWQQLTIPFEYYSDARPYYVLASFSTNSVPGKGDASDWMYIDDIEMLYYSELASAVYNGKTLQFTDGKAQVDAPYNDKMLKLKAAGVGATIRTSMNEETFVLTIVVRGDNFSKDPTNQHTYEIQFTGIAGALDDEADVVVTPETTIENAAIAESRFYLKNVATGQYLGNTNELTSTPHLWKVNGTYTFTDGEGKALNLTRKSSSSSFSSSNFNVLSNSTEATTFTAERAEDGSYYLYLPNFQYYDGFLSLGKKYADIYYAASATNGLFCTTERNEYTKWALIDINQYDRVTSFWKNYAKASLKRGIEVRGFFTPGRTQSVTGLPLGIYEFGQSGKFYLPAGESIVITSEQSRQTLTYYGRLDFSLNATYNNKKVVDNKVEDFYNAEAPLALTLGNGAEGYMTDFDNETGRLTLIISGYGRSKEHEVQFAVPEMTLTAEWRGQTIEAGASIDEEYNPELLTLTSGAGTSYETSFDAETGLLTVVVTSVYGQTKTLTFQFAVYPEVLASYPFEEQTLINQYCNSVPFSQEQLATITVELTADGKANFLLNDFATLDKQGKVVNYDTLVVRGVDRTKQGILAYVGRVRTENGDTLAVNINAQHLMASNELHAAVTVMADSVQTDYFYNIQVVREDTFIGDIRVAVNGKSAGTERTSIVVSHLSNGNINFRLADFTLEDVGKVGTINILNKEYNAEAATFGFEGDLFIAPGTTGDPSEWIGPSLGAIPVNLEGEIKQGLLTVFINIDFREKLGQIVSVTFITDPTVGIRDIDAADDGETFIYDLSGRRVAMPIKGLYIVGGRKVLY